MTTADETRQRLLDAAGPLFAEQGLKATTVRVICDRAGVNLAAINYHFRDKMGLYREVLQLAIDELQAVTVEAKQKGEGCSPDEKLRRFIHIHRDAETGELRQRASPLAMLLLLSIIVLKLGARQVFGAAAATQPGSPALLLTDAFIGFALGLLSATRLELYLRARRLLSAV